MSDNTLDLLLFLITTVHGACTSISKHVGCSVFLFHIFVVCLLTLGLSYRKGLSWIRTKNNQDILCLHPLDVNSALTISNAIKTSAEYVLLINLFTFPALFNAIT